MKEGGLERISVNSAAFEAHRKRLAHLKGPQVLGAFGEATLELVDIWRREKNVEREVEVKSFLRSQRKKLLMFSETSIMSFSRFFEDIIASPAFAGRIRELVTDTPPEGDTPKIIIMRKFLSGELDDEVFEEMLRIHVENFKRKTAEFAQKLLEIKARFRSRALEAIASGYLPITVEELDRRMEATTVELCDSVENQFDDFDGDHNVETEHIRIGSHVPEAYWDHAITHESIHALSGRTVIHQSGERPRLGHQRLGVRFASAWADKKKARFRWLNEAITERITIDLLGESDGSYDTEREVLQGLIDRGIPREELYRAYFENYDAKAAVPIPAWKKLTETIKEIYPEGMREFVRLDEQMKKEVK